MSKAAEIENFLAPIVGNTGFEIVDVQYLSEGGRWVLRVFIDSPESSRAVTLDDCGRVSAVVGDALDGSGAPATAGGYILEISSPGTDRVLKREKDFLRFAGRSARVSLYEPLDGQRNFTGKISGFENGALTLEITGGKTVRLEAGKIARARLAPDTET